MALALYYAGVFFSAEISEGYDVRKRQKPSEAAPLIGVCQQTVSKYVDEAKAIVKKFYEDQV